MKNEKLIEELKMFSNNSIPTILLDRSTMLRINKSVIKHSAHDENLFVIKSVEKDSETGSPILKLE